MIGKRVQLLSASLLIIHLPASAQTVLRVSDGDSITVQINGDHQRIRLACIDAPELQQDPFGLEARDRLQILLPVGTTIQLRPMAQDRFGRLVAEVFHLGQNLNLQLVREGQAVVYRQFLQGCDRNAYLPAEFAARQQRLGLWQQPNPVMPWDFRRDRSSSLIGPPADQSMPVDCYSYCTSSILSF